jgi:hypothetical protein
MMTEVLTLAPLKDLRLGECEEEVADALAGRSSERFTARAVSTGQHVTPRFYLLIFSNRELFTRFGQLSEKGKNAFAHSLEILIEQTRPPASEVGSRTEVEFAWSVTKLRRIKVVRTRKNLRSGRYCQDDIHFEIELV